MLRQLAQSVSVIILGAAVYAGCSGSQFGGKTAESDEDTDREDETADEPTQVSGAFLTVLCDANGFQVDEAYNIGRDPVVACIIKKDDGSRFTDPVTSVIAEVFENEGQALAAEALVAATPPWHFYVKVSDDDRKKITAGRFQIAAGAKTDTVSTKTFDYKWYDDPLIKGLVAALIGKPEPKKVEEGMAILLQKNNPYRAEHIIFASDTLFQGNMTTAAADSYCQEQGNALLTKYAAEGVAPHVTWRALIGTDQASARDRIPVVGSVFNVYGQKVSQYAQHFQKKYPDKDPDDLASKQAMFWEEKLAANIGVTQTGRLVNLFDKVEGGLQVVDVAWTGAAAAGAQPSPLANCANWTKTDGTGIIGDLNSRIQPTWINTATLSCARYARIMCMSMSSEVTQ